MNRNRLTNVLLGVAGAATLITAGVVVQQQLADQPPPCLMWFTNGSTLMLPGRTTRWDVMASCPDREPFVPASVEYGSADSSKVFVWPNGGGLILTARPGQTEVGARWISPAGDTVIARRFMDVRFPTPDEAGKTYPAFPTVSTDSSISYPCSKSVKGYFLETRGDTAFFVYTPDTAQAHLMQSYCVPFNMWYMLEYDRAYDMGGPAVRIAPPDYRRDLPGYAEIDTTRGVFGEPRCRQNQPECGGVNAR